MRFEIWLLTGALLAANGLAVAAPTNSHSNVEIVVGNHLWHPDRHYHSSANWLALSCTNTGCSLEPAKLSVRSQQWQGHYDDVPTRGQKLDFRKVKSGTGKVIAWFRHARKVTWLVPGTITTYGSIVTRFRRPSSEGTLELALDIPNGGEARLVPLLNRKESKFLLQLRENDRRQTLGELGGCTHDVSLTYLLWAGDLDSDGRPDYLVSVDEQFVLYLSSKAKGDALVGVGGSYSVSFDGECDGSGWIES